MKHLIRPVLLVAVALGFTLWASHMFAFDPSEQAVQIKISVVAYGGQNNERWRSLDLGIRQACGELGIDNPAVTIAPSDDPGYQITLLRREVENGARGLIIAAADTEMMTGYLEETPPGVHAVLLEAPAGDDSLWIGADNVSIGRALADRLAGERGVIAVLEEGVGRESVSVRYEAFLSRMNELGREVAILKRADPWEKLGAAISSGLATHKPGIDILVALDNDALEAAVDALPAAMVGTRLYGVGSSEKVIHALDSGDIEYVIFQNEYAAGYLATMSLAARLGLIKAFAAPDIGYVEVTRDIMYLPEMERLIFPITQ